MKSDTYILEIDNEWCGVGEIDRIQELITYYLENGIKELTFKVINITQFMKEKQTTIKWVAGTNPTISENDEWRDDNDWNKQWEDYIIGSNILDDNYKNYGSENILVGKTIQSDNLKIK